MCTILYNSVRHESHAENKCLTFHAIASCTQSATIDLPPEIAVELLKGGKVKIGLVVY